MPTNQKKKVNHKKRRSNQASNEIQANVIQKKAVICIIGMHRSGTSMVTRLLNLCGLDLGPKDQLMPPYDGNPLGYFENETISYRIDDALLEHFGGSWHNPPPFKEGWEKDSSLEQIIQKAKSLIKTFSKSSHWGWKDPRTTILLPFWKSLIPNLRFVICVRSPLEVAKSLAKRDNIPIQEGVYLWYYHMQAAIRDTEDCPRIFACYEDFFHDAPREIDRLIEFCRLQQPVDLSLPLEAITSELRHEKSGIFELLNEDKILSEYKLFYMGLLGIMADGTVRRTSAHNSEELISESVSKFYELLEHLHDENEILQLQSALLDLERDRNVWKLKVEDFVIERGKWRGDVENLELSIADKENQISNLLEHAKNLEKVIACRDDHLNNLIEHGENVEKVIANNETHINNLVEHAKNLENGKSHNETQINNLVEHANNLEKAIASRDDHLNNLIEHGENLEKVIANNETHINNLVEHAKNLEKEINSKEGHVGELIKHIGNLEKAITENDVQLSELAKHGENLEKVILERENHISGLLEHTANLDRTIAEKESHIDDLERFVREKDIQLASLQDFEKRVKDTIPYKLYRFLRLHKAFTSLAFVLAWIQSSIRG